MKTQLMIVMATASFLNCGGQPTEQQSINEPVSSLHQAEVTPRLVYEIDYPYSGGAWGASYEVDLGLWCPYYAADRAYFEAYNAWGSGWCTAEYFRGRPLGWISGDSHDCRIRVHIGANLWQDGACRVKIYAWQPL